MRFEWFYKDNVSGKIDDARFSKMFKRYAREQGRTQGGSKLCDWSRKNGKRCGWIWSLFGNGVPATQKLRP